MKNAVQILQSLTVSRVDFVNTYLADCGHYPMLNDGRYRCALILTVSGDECYRCSSGGEEYQTHPGTVLFLPQGLEYQITMTEPLSDARVIDFTLAGDELPRPFLIEPKSMDKLLSIYSDSERIWSRQSPSSELHCRALLYQLLSELAEDLSNYMPSYRQHQLDSAMNYLYQHYTDQDFRVGTLPEISGLSHRYFNSLFTEKYGDSPKEYVTELRITRAKNLLMTEKLSIGSIAESLGYCDIYHFSRIFKKKTGMTPTEYKRGRR